MPPKGSRTADHGDSRYRSGCRCQACRDGHAVASHDWKWERRYGDGAPMGPKTRKQILSSLKRTGNVMATARELGLTHQSIYRAGSAVPGFGDLIAKLTAPRD